MVKSLKYLISHFLIKKNKVLANNAAKDASELVSKLKLLHNAAQTSGDPKHKEYKWSGLDLIEGKVRNNKEAGVLEPLVSKIKCIRYFCEAEQYIFPTHCLI